MNGKIPARVLVIFITCFFLSNNSHAKEAYAEGIIVTLKSSDTIIIESKNLATKTSKKLGVKQKKSTKIFGKSTLIEFDKTLTKSEAEEIANEIKNDPTVLSAEPNYLNTINSVRPEVIPNDTNYFNQWNLSYGHGGINANYAWATSRGDNVVVAVVDSGILNQHPDLAGQILSGYDFISNSVTARDGNGRDSNPTDTGDWNNATECPGQPSKNSSWHGTKVAGVIAAIDNNNLHLTGVAPNARILPVRFLGKCGGTTVDMADAIRWAAGLPISGVPTNPNPAQVINISAGGIHPCTTYLQNAINAATVAGATVIASAGNNDIDVANASPASCNNVIAVAGNDIYGDLWGTSNFGNLIAVTAPAGSYSLYLLSNTGTQTASSNFSVEYDQGTSFAAPHVSGVAAMLYQINPNITPAQVRSQITSNAREVDCIYETKSCGNGILDAEATVNQQYPTTPFQITISNSGGQGQIIKRYYDGGFVHEDNICSFSQTDSVKTCNGSIPVRHAELRAISANHVTNIWNSGCNSTDYVNDDTCHVEMLGGNTQLFSLSSTSTHTTVHIEPYTSYGFVDIYQGDKKLCTVGKPEGQPEIMCTLTFSTTQVDLKLVRHFHGSSISWSYCDSYPAPYTCRLSLNGTTRTLRANIDYD